MKNVMLGAIIPTTSSALKKAVSFLVNDFIKIFLATIKRINPQYYIYYINKIQY